ncbi:hypothetical protein [Hymenobacter psychrophilus]|uniref:DnaJ domain-containing protein n=1 Tax=Hymenobacter psychrophilus TaxID=651662 RepID=A0A1H3FKD2_9BACT|nr:hypothetical protein [Hymenobacter psychrophilus]SDX91390.1 hypothetical protein SAMN04488069_104115 [Hymenobacter psychrophilus]
MAKKPTPAPQPALVHIPVASAGADSLSKEQKAFNRLTKRIGKLEGEVSEFRAAADQLRQRVQNEYRPLQTRHHDQRAALVRALGHAYEHQKLTKTERNKIVDLVVHRCADLLDRGYDDLEPIFDTLDPPPTAEEAAALAADEADLEAQTAEMMKDMYRRQFGIEFDEDADVSTPAKFQAYVTQQLAARKAEYEQQEAEAQERRAKRKKSPKQQAAADKKKAEEQNTTQAVRTLYMDLVKHLHPDREPDEAEKIRKTELLARVTTAYKAGELLTLLRLQLELNRIDQAHLENLAEDRLRYFNKLLREQARELDQQLFDEQTALQSFTGQGYFYTTSRAAMELDFLHMKANLEQKIRQLEAEVTAFGHDPNALKAFLKDYKIPRPGAGPMYIKL